MIPRILFSIAIAAALSQNLISFGQKLPSLNTLSVITLASNLNFLNLLDGPSDISHASTTPTTNSLPTLAQMKYYNYYAAAMYCQFQLNDLSCVPCRKFRNDVYDHTGGIMYTRPNDLSSELETFSPTVIMNNDTDNTAVVAVSKTRREIVVAFRGTMNIWNVVLDLAGIAVNYPNIPAGIKLHAGFHTATMSLHNDVSQSTVLNLRFYSKYISEGGRKRWILAKLLSKLQNCNCRYVERCFFYKTKLTHSTL